jgi:hypothetical protein
MTSNTRAARNKAVPARYPQFSVIVTVLPPVSPNVVAAILMIQKVSVTSRTLLDCSDISGFVTRISREDSYVKTTFIRAENSAVPQYSICGARTSRAPR